MLLLLLFDQATTLAMVAATVAGVAADLRSPIFRLPTLFIFRNLPLRATEATPSPSSSLLERRSFLDTVLDIAVVAAVVVVVVVGVVLVVWLCLRLVKAVAVAGPLATVVTAVVGVAEEVAGTVSSVARSW